MTFSCEAVLLDLDGVLVNSEAVVERHWRLWAQETGIDLELIMRSAHGVRTIDTIRLVAPHLDAQAETARFEAREERDVEGVVAASGSAELIAALAGRPWAVVTSGPRALASGRLKHAGLPIPHVMITAESVANGKPAPDAYLLAASRLGVSPGACVVVEDAPAGVAAGRAAGMAVIGVATTHEREKLATADVVVPGLNAIGVHDGPSPGRLLLVVNAG
jgi:sugar-phosphatase